MTDSNHYRQLIERRITALEKSVGRDDKSMQDVELDQTRVGRLSRMDAMQMQQMELELERRQLRELQGLRTALARVDDDGFGECLECGDDINPKRLEIDLTATLCIKCAEKREKAGR